MSSVQISLVAFSFYHLAQMSIILSPFLFILYINGAVKEEGCGVECEGETIPGLPFADDTCLMASDPAGLRKCLDVLVV